MDASRFEVLTRSLGIARSRRSALGLLALVATGRKWGAQGGSCTITQLDPHCVKVCCADECNTICDEAGRPRWPQRGG